MIAAIPVALDSLRVCWQSLGPYNCGECEKCLRTMMALQVVGASSKAFPAPLDLERVRRLPVRRAAQQAFLQELYESLLASGEHADLRLALHECLQNSRPDGRGDAVVFRPRKEWFEQLDRVDRIIEETVPFGQPFIFVDQEEMRESLENGERALPFLERDGQYWGPPPDDSTAIQEVERLRRGGATTLIVARPAFWWLDHYQEFHRHLRSSFACVGDDDQFVIFDLTVHAEWP